MTSAILNLKCFSHGDSAEEFCLPLLAISLYYLIDYFKNIDPKPIPTQVVLWNGFIAGCIIWIKYSMAGFWIGWIAAVFFCTLFQKQYQRSAMVLLFFLCGVVIATLPWVVYFGVNQSISEWIDTYLILNLTSYSLSTSFLSHFILPLYAISNQFYVNPIFNGILWLGVIVFLRHGKFIKSRLYRILLLLCILFLVLGIYGGGRWYVYYYLIISPLIVFGVIVLHDLIYSRINKMFSLKSAVSIILIIILITIPATLIFNQNATLLKIKKDELVQFKFASIINQSKNATLLNYGVLDFGIYTTTGITPNVRFFAKQNILYSMFPMIEDEQKRYIREKTVDYVVTRQPASEPIENLDVPYLFDNYTLIESDKQEDDHAEYNYYLFKVIN